MSRPACRSHLVQFYTSDVALAEAAGHYLAEGLRRGGSAVLIAVPAHRDALSVVLRREGLDPEALAASGRLARVDAAATLARCMPGGRPDWDAFVEAVAPLLDRAAASGGCVRAYDETMDVLWAGGRRAAVIELEGFWNRLLSSREVCVYCAYRADLLLDGSPEVLGAVLREHTNLLERSLRCSLGEAVEGAMEELLGAEALRSLRPVIESSRSWGAELPWGETAVSWLRGNMPELAERVVARARVRLAGPSGAA